MSNDYKRPEEPKQLPRERRNRLPLAIFILVFLLMFLMELFGSSCFYLSVFGVPCAGCGTTRAGKLLLEGKILDALRMHPLIFVTIFLFISIPILLLIRWYRLKKGKSFPFDLTSKTLNAFLIGVTVLYLTVYVIRMILLFPHTEPMIYNQESVLGRVIGFFRTLFGG